MAYGICKGGPLDGMLLTTANTPDGDRFAVVRSIHDCLLPSGVYEWNGYDETFDFAPSPTPQADLRAAFRTANTEAATAALAR
jgi:hypothetical protein